MSRGSSLAVAAVCLCVGAVGCTSPGTSQIQSALNLIPENEYVILMGFRPADIARAGIVLRSMEKVNALLEKQGATEKIELDKLLAKAGIKGLVLDDLQSAVIAASVDQPRDFLIYVGGNIQTEDLEEAFDVLPGGLKPEKEKYKDREYWLDEDDSFYCYQAAGGVFLAASDKVIEQVIDNELGDGKRMVSTREFEEARGLVDWNASLFLLMMDYQTILESGGQDYMRIMLERLVDDEDLVREGREFIKEVEAAGISLYVGETLGIRGETLFEKEEVARDYSKFHRRMVDAVYKDGGESLKRYLGRILPFNIPLAFDAEALKTMAEEIDIAQVGSKVAVSTRGGFSGAVEKLLWGSLETVIENAEDLKKQEVTVNNVRRLGLGIDTYFVDQGFLPSSAELPDLERQLIELGYVWRSEREELSVDGWGNALIYRCHDREGDRSYTVMSYGSDGKLGPEDARKGEVKFFDQDILWANGGWVQAPVGEQSKRKSN